MTHQIRHFTLHPIGRGLLHADPTCNGARQESLRIWASERCATRGATPVDSASTLAKRASAPRR